MSHTLLEGIGAVRSTLGLLLRMLSTAGDADQRPTVRSIAGMGGTRHVEWISPGLEKEWLGYTPIQQQ